jgi:hypothetical protein
MSVPASEPLLPPAHKVPYFKGAFFWYVALQVALSTAIFIAVSVYFFTAGMLYADDPAALQAQAAVFDKAAQPIGSILTLILCMNVAKRHKTGFGRGILLFFAGNITAAAICIPLIAVAMMGEENASLTWLAGYLFTIVVYAVGCIVIVVRRRRKDAASRLQRESIARFD